MAPSRNNRLSTKLQLGREETPYQQPPSRPARTLRSCWLEEIADYSGPSALPGRSVGLAWQEQLGPDPSADLGQKKGNKRDEEQRIDPAAGDGTEPPPKRDHIRERMQAYEKAVHELRRIDETPGEWADFQRAIQEVDRTERNLPTVGEQLHWDTTVDESSLSDEERRGILDRRATRWSRIVEVHDEGVDMSDDGWLSLVEPVTGVQTTLSNGHGLFTLPPLESDSMFLSIGTNGSSGDGSQSSISSSPPNISSSLPVPRNFPNPRPWDGKSKFPDMPFSNWQSFPH